MLALQIQTLNFIPRAMEESWNGCLHPSTGKAESEAPLLDELQARGRHADTDS